MLPVIAGVIGAVSAVADLFSAGKRVYEQVTGKPSTASTPAELQTAIEAAPPDQQAAWIAAMQVEIESYRAQNERLANEQGEVTPELLHALPPETAAEVAYLRMTTRPRVVLRMSHVMLVPAYVLAIDAFTILLNGVAAWFGSEKTLPLLGPALFGERSVYRYLFDSAVWPATTIVLAYILLREVSKRTGKGEDDAGVDLIAQLGNAVGSIKNIFTRKKP